MILSAGLIEPVQARSRQLISTEMTETDSRLATPNRRILARVSTLRRHRPTHRNGILNLRLRRIGRPRLRIERHMACAHETALVRSICAQKWAPQEGYRLFFSWRLDIGLNAALGRWAAE